MKNKRIWLLALMVCVMYGTVHVYATPGTTEDPLVSKSYVDGKINEMMAYIQANMAPGTTGTSGAEPSTPSPGTGAQYVPVKAETGQYIIGGEGTEIILRSGEAQCYATGANGLVNITLGVEAGNGANLQQNHLYIVPRADGRGVVARSEAWFMVKGEYSIR